MTMTTTKTIIIIIIIIIIMVLPWENQWHYHNKFKTSGICQLQCPTCTKIYTGQIGKNFNTILIEHQKDFYINKTSFAEYVIKNTHLFGKLEEII